MNKDEKFYSSLNPDEQSLFNLYKSNGPHPNGQFYAGDINTMLGLGTPLSEEEKLNVALLDEIIRKNSLETETWLYRATDDRFISRHIKDGLLTYPAFMSTSTEIDELHGHFSNADTTPAVLRIKCPQGTFAAPMEGNSEFGSPEYEYLLSRNGVFRIIDRKEITVMREIEEIMGKFHAIGFLKLIDYTLEFLYYEK